MGKASLVLASNSPRRRELMAIGGWTFETRPAEVDESQFPGEAPDSYVLRLADNKASLCASLINNTKPSPTNLGTRAAGDDLIILAADTAVVDGKAILGKPRDRIEASAMLQRLRGRNHQVFTGIVLLRISDGNKCTDLCVTNVPMRNYGDDEVEKYVASGDPLDKAGAYAIQHPEFHPVEKFSGCYASVMGLPLCHVTRALRNFGIATGTDISAGCQSNLEYTCPISAAVLRGEQVG